MPVTFEDHPFWDFSLAVYGAPGVSTACIALQDRRGVDVNVLLFCTWTGASGRGRLGTDELAAAVTAVGAWNREVVCGLRAVRRWMRTARTGIADAHAVGLRRRIIDIEVQCEHAEQLALAGAVRRPAAVPLPADGGLDDAIANCALYLARFDGAPDDSDRADLATILAAAIPQMQRGSILAKLEEGVARG